MIASASQGIHERKHLIMVENIHSLVNLAMDISNNNQQQNASENDKGLLMNALKTLYHLAYFDRPRYHIPGETATQSKNRQKFAVCGGLIALIYICSNSALPEVKEFCEAKKMNDVEAKDLDLATYVMQLYLEKKENCNKIENPDPAQNAMFLKYGLTEPIEKNDIIFPEKLEKTVKFSEFMQYVEEESKKKKEETAKKAQEIQAQKISQKKEEILKKNEEEKLKKEKVEQAFQEYMKKVDQKKREKMEKEKKDKEEKENKMKEEEETKKNLQEMLKKKEEERKKQRALELRKKVEEEKKDAEEKARKVAEHIEQQKKAFDEWNKRKKESKKKKSAKAKGINSSMEFDKKEIASEAKEIKNIKDISCIAHNLSQKVLGYTNEQNELKKE